MRPPRMLYLCMVARMGFTAAGMAKSKRLGKLYEPPKVSECLCHIIRSYVILISPQMGIWPITIGIRLLLTTLSAEENFGVRKPLNFFISAESTCAKTADAESNNTKTKRRFLTLLFMQNTSGRLLIANLP